MKRYLLLFRNDQSNVDDLPESDLETLFARFVSWTEDLQRRGRFQTVAQLRGPGGQTVRRRQGALALDGPYAEGKEAVVGLYIIVAENLDDATRIAEEVPFLDYGGSVEVRELGDFPLPGAAPQ